MVEILTIRTTKIENLVKKTSIFDTDQLFDFFYIFRADKYSLNMATIIKPSLNSAAFLHVTQPP